MKFSFIYILVICTSIFITAKIKINKVSVGDLKPSEVYLLSKQFPYFNEGSTKLNEICEKEILNPNNKKYRGANNWEIEGPHNISGRINTIAIHPQNQDIILVGTPNGGIMRTTNGGISWTPVFDNMSTLTVGVIIFDTINPNIVYAGTGDNVLGGYSYIGAGVYKSTDAGITWNYFALKELACISKIVIDPTNSSNILVAAMGNPFLQDANRGLYKTTDGGLNWTKILHIANDVGIADLVISPTSFNTIYATGRHRQRSNLMSNVIGLKTRIYRSTNGGANWDTLTNGLPSGKLTRIGLAISKTNANKIYALVVDSTMEFDGIYRSLNAGTTWTLMGSSSIVNMGGFGWYFGEIRLNPTNDNTVYVLAVDFFKSTNGGANFSLNAPPWSTYEVHADKHDLQFIDNNSYLLATDGGLYRTDDGGNNWIDKNNMPITQFYEVAYNSLDAQNYYGGAQDNGTSFGNSLGLTTWQKTFGGDGFKPAFDAIDANIYYNEVQNGALYCIDNGNITNISSSLNADRTNWNTPYILDKFAYQQMYIGTYKIYKNTTSTIDNWTAISGDLTDGITSTADEPFHTITTIAQHYSNPDILYVGTSDANIWVTINGGSSWQQINAGLPNRYVTCVEHGGLNNQTIFASFSGYRNADSTSYLFKSINNGSSWISIAGDLPAFSINDIYVHHSGNDSSIAVATDGGVYATVNAGINWKRVGDNMPIFPVFDLAFNNTTNKLIAGTFARSMQTINIDSVFKKATPVIGVAVSTVLANDLKINCAPNPCNNSLSFFTNYNKQLSYSIISLNGKKWGEGTFTSNTTFNTQLLPDGNYYVIINDTKNRVTKKITVQH
jgi:photosystem II stability/assembly factor-like uncharacterized protein